MKPREKAVMEPVDIVAEALDRSLMNLGIEPSRFRSLPLMQRRLAIKEAVFNTASQKLRDLDWLEERSGFHESRLADFSHSEILQHQASVDALVAMVCLGEMRYAQPLVTYMSFPEPRWRILIEPVLRAISEQTVSEPVYRLPSLAEVRKWRLWTASESTQSGLSDYSERLMERMGARVVGQREAPRRVHRNYYQPAKSRTIVAHRWRYFDSALADYCASLLYPEIRSASFDRFLELLDGLLRDNPQAAHTDTLSACIRDGIAESGVSLARFRWHVLSQVSTEAIQPQTWMTIFDALKRSVEDRRWANAIARKIAGEDISRQLLILLSDALICSVRDSYVFRTVLLIDNLDSWSSAALPVAEHLKPRIWKTLLGWLERILGWETESLCVLGSEDPENRDHLAALLAARFRKNSDSMRRVERTMGSADAAFSEFGTKLVTMRRMRSKLARTFSEDPNVDIHSLTVEYSRILDWYAREIARLAQDALGMPLLANVASGLPLATSTSLGSADQASAPRTRRAGRVVHRVDAGQAAPVRPSFSSGDLTVNFAERRVTIGGREVKLTPTEYRLLQELVRNADKVLTHDHLLNKVWGPEYREERGYLRVYAGRLRAKLESDPAGPSLILNVPGVGYTFVSAE